MAFPPLPPEALDLDRDALVRVEVADHPQAYAGTEGSSVLLAPPEDGTPWAWEAVPRTDGFVDERLVDATNLAPWHARGATGAGVKVAVFDIQWVGVETLMEDLAPVTTHDCWLSPSCEPPLDTTRPRFSFERGVHGAACAELVRMVAPDAELHLVRVNSRSMFENAVTWAIREDIDVISMSMSFFNQSFFDGTGPMAEEVERLRAHDILLVTSAGNYARGHWHGPWTDGDGDGRLDFDGSNQLELELDGGSGRAYVSWNQFGICGTTDLDAILYDQDGNIVLRSASDQEPAFDSEDHRCEPFERLTGPPDDGTYLLEVRRRRGSVADLIVDVMAPGGRVTGTVRQTSIVDPGMHPAALTIGAVDVRGYLENDVEVFSSQGPSITGHVKPDLAAPDGISTRSYGTRGFFGTSAATPVAAGMVAVVMSEEPGLTPYEAADRLRGFAWDDGSLDWGDDVRWGAGKIRLPATAEPVGCGRRPLWLGVLIPLLVVLRRRR